MIQKYFKEKIISFEKINGHFNKNYKVKLESGFYHLKIFKDNKHEIKTWIEGETIKTGDKKNIRLVCKEMMNLHKQSKKGPKMDYHTKKIKDKKYNLLIEKYKNDNGAPCHNDLNKDNIVINDKRAFLIDFEFKRINDIYGEIANIINEDNLNEFHINLFIKNYEGLNPLKLNDFIYINKTFVKGGKNKFL